MARVVIASINFLGMLLLLLSLMGTLVLHRLDFWFLVMCSMTPLFVGWFMVRINASPRYSKGIFQFTWHDFVLPTFLSIILSLLVYFQVVGMGWRILLWVCGTSAVWVLNIVIIRLGNMVGVELENRLKVDLAE